MKVEALLPTCPGCVQVLSGAICEAIMEKPASTVTGRIRLIWSTTFIHSGVDLMSIVRKLCTTAIHRLSLQAMKHGGSGKESPTQPLHD